MEGQQPDSSAVADVDETEVDEAAFDDAGFDAAAFDDAAPEVKKRRDVRVGLAALALAAFVAAGGFAGAAVQSYVTDRATVATKLRIARTAGEAIGTLWSYTPQNMDTLPDRAQRYLSREFEEQYRSYVAAIAPRNKQAQVTSETTVVAAAVESLRPQTGEATAIVYTNTTATTPQNNGIPSLKFLSYRLEFNRHGRDWLLTKMIPVTSLDLTPKVGM